MKSKLFEINEFEKEFSSSGSSQEDKDELTKFEDELKYPMIPDYKLAVDKAKSKFPVIIQQAGWALALIIVVMFAALGLVGFLIFLFGISFIVILQIALVVRYISNEHRRAAEREMEEEIELEEMANQVTERDSEDDPMSQFHNID